ncbi:hypothetical protein Hanom_Chr17g01571511 [Helianthus anomalus]
MNKLLTMGRMKQSAEWIVHSSGLYISLGLNHMGCACLMIGLDMFASKLYMCV